MLSARILAQLSAVAHRDAHAALDPEHYVDWTDRPRGPRLIMAQDWADHARLDDLSVALWDAAMLAGWPAQDSPWETDDENERRRCFEWDEVLP